MLPLARTYLVVNTKFKGGKMIKTEAEVTTVGKEFYSPMLRALEKATGKRECPEFTAPIKQFGQF